MSSTQDQGIGTGTQLHPNHHFHRHGVSGIALIVIGIVALIATLTNSDVFGLLFLPALGVIFLIWGIMNRQARLLIPAGILLGLGVGVLLAHENILSGGKDNPAMILLCMGLGFIIITPLSIAFAERREIWPLLPGGFLAVVGILFFLGGAGWVNATKIIWPLFLILFGLYLLFEWNRRARRQQ